MWSRRGMTDLQRNSCRTGEGWAGEKSNVMSIERLLINMANSMAFLGSVLSDYIWILLPVSPDYAIR